tara:strand:- start:83 stop:844 length:762 start_codon:yes stop_codon:yes gene_type:complete
MTKIKGASILITGGGSGIGAGTAEYLVDQGAKVTICGRRRDKIQQVANSIGSDCHASHGDICSEEDRIRIVTESVTHGGGLDALVNNAGNMYRVPLESIEEGALIDVFHSNVIAPMMMSRLCLPYLAKSKGSIVFLGSIHNRRSFPGVSPYAATKAAIESVTRSLSAELGVKDIRVNCVAPGAVFTEINQRAGESTDEEALSRLREIVKLNALTRIGEAKEIAHAISYFIEAPWTTGAILDVDGGLGLGLTRA